MHLMVIGVKRLKGFVLTFAAVISCFIVIVALVSLTYPLSRLSIFRILPYEWSTRLIEAMPNSLLGYLAKRVSLQCARLKGFCIRWAKWGEDAVFVNDITICLQSIHQKYARVEAFKKDDGATLWTCSIPNPVWEKGLDTDWKLSAWRDEVWAIALNAGEINALDLKSGKLLWKHEFWFPIWGIHKGKKVAFIVHEKGVLCFEPKTRRTLWEIREENVSTRVIDKWLQVFANPYGDEPAYTRWFSLEDGKPVSRPPKIKPTKTEKFPKSVERLLKHYKEVGIVGRTKNLILIGAEVGTERLIAVDAKSGKMVWESKTEISSAHCCGRNFQFFLTNELLFYCVTSNHSSHTGEGSQLFAIDPRSGKVVAKAEWINPIEQRREAFEILKVEGKQVFVHLDGDLLCKLELVS